jgi:hypothetical protein
MNRILAGPGAGPAVRHAGKRPVRSRLQGVRCIDLIDTPILWVYDARHVLATAENSLVQMFRVLVGSIPALIHTARPDSYLDCFRKPWLECEFGES